MSGIPGRQTTGIWEQVAPIHGHAEGWYTSLDDTMLYEQFDKNQILNQIRIAHNSKN